MSLTSLTPKQGPLLVFRRVFDKFDTEEATFIVIPMCLQQVRYRSTDLNCYIVDGRVADRAGVVRAVLVVEVTIRAEDVAASAVLTEQTVIHLHAFI